MTGPVFVVFVGMLLALFLLIVAALLWQEAKHRSFQTEPDYVIEDLLRHIHEHLPPGEAERLGRDGVERIVDWEIRYLLRDGGPGAVAGGTDHSVSYVVDRIARFHGVSYAPDDVRVVLALEAGYLLRLGVVGDRAQ